MIVNQVIGGWGKTSLIPHESAKPEENERRNSVLSELRDFVAFHGNQSALAITYEAIEDRFADLIGVRTAHFNAITGRDAFGNVENLFVVGRPLPAPAELRDLALALTGRPIPEENPGQLTRGALMADGTGRPLKVRAYADPTLEELRSAVTDAEIRQAVGRGRGVNRTAANPLTVWVLADTLLPHPLSRLAGWGDVRLDAVQRMAARGLVLSSPVDAVQFYPNLFDTVKSAEWHLKGISPGFPYGTTSHRETRGKSFAEVRYRPTGRGQQTRRAFVAEWRLATIRDDLEGALGGWRSLNLAARRGRPSRSRLRSMSQ